MRTDFFNEAIVTAMLAASSSQEEGTPETGAGGEDLTKADALRERLITLMDRADRSAAQAGMPGDLVEAADFAVCAFIDETLLSSASWRGRTEWLKKPLQFTRHGTATAGEDFYRVLDSLLEEAEKKAPFLARSEEEAEDARKREDADARNPLYAVLEIFALCLAQGFTGMFYNNREAIQNELDKIGRFVPAVKRRAESFSFSPAGESEKQGALRRTTDLIRRFDFLDWALWIIPPALTALLYVLCETRLDEFLQAFLHGSSLP